MSDDPVAVVLAAGTGSRLGDELPKQFVELNGASVLERTLRSLAWCDRIVVVHHPEHLDRTRQVVEQVRRPGHARLVPGGSTRRLSITAALAVLDDLPEDVPLILQNAASPNTPKQLFVECLQALGSYDVAQAHVPALHTIFAHDAGELTQVLDRKALGYSVDPTVYRLGCLRRIVRAQESALSEGEMTLDTARQLGIRVRLVPSPDSNVKLTTRNDLIVLRALTQSG